MNKILDEEEVNKGKEFIDKRIKHPIRTSISYLITILCGFFACAHYGLITILFERGQLDISSCITAMIFFTLTLLILGFAIEILKLISRKFIAQKNERVILYLNPFWFRVVERAFGMTIILITLALISKAVGYN